MSRAALAGKVALVTGGGSGIGRAVAEAFAEAGARVVVSGRRAAPLAETAAAIGPDRAATAEGDVTRAADRAAMLAACRARFGGLDVLVNNAGVVPGRGPLAEIDEEAWRRAYEINVTAPVLLARDALPALRERRGCVVNVSTGSSLRPVPGYGAYGSSKAALNYASQVLALEAAPEVRVNVICPGGVDTPIFSTFLDADGEREARAWFAQATPLGRMGAPADVAAAALWLASDAAAWVTGVVLPVDGGLNVG